MNQMVAGYKLINIASGDVISSWGGTWGQCPGVPSPISLPNGDHVHAPSINTDYAGYMLTEWMVDEPAPVPPESITRRQCALQLLALQIITPEEALAMTKSAEVPTAVAAVFNQAVANGAMTADQRIFAEIDFAAPSYYRSNSLLLLMGLTKAEIDQFFIAASKL